MIQTTKSLTRALDAFAKNEERFDKAAQMDGTSLETQDEFFYAMQELNAVKFTTKMEIDRRFKTAEDILNKM